MDNLWTNEGEAIKNTLDRFKSEGLLANYYARANAMSMSFYDTLTGNTQDDLVTLPIIEPFSDIMCLIGSDNNAKLSKKSFTITLFLISKIT